MANQFKNSFIRQMGRETAHDIYKGITNTTADLISVDEDSFTGRLIWTEYLSLGLTSIAGLIIPFVMIIPMILGVIRLVGPKIKGHYKGVYSLHKTDGRYRGGRQYLGESEGWGRAKRPVADCTEEQVRAGRISGAIEIAISLLVLILGMAIQY